MGLDNVKLAYARWTHIPDPGFRLLVYMALHSMDDGRPPLFWLGREEMASALGRRMPDEPAPSDNSTRAEADRNQRKADLQAVKRALMQLTKVGVVALDRAPRPGYRARYKILLEAGTGYAGRTERGTPDVLTEYAGRTASSTPDVPPRRTPYGGSSEDQLDQTPGSISPLVGNSPADELDYVAAQLILNSLPDLGTEYMRRVEDIQGYPGRVVAAALLARAERSAS